MRVYVGVTEIWAIEEGSPPRMRGKGRLFHALGHYHGITPAHAGKRTGDRSDGHCRWDHPRACGEKSQIASVHSSSKGSPPRMRGKGQCGVVAQRIRRITPAHAGKSFCAVRISQEQKDHPRVCGEKLILYTDRCVKPGSPPRVRGKGTSTRWRETAGRITPACAGKSVHPLHNSVMHGDHPRVCGEK